MEQEGQDKIREAVGMREGNAADVRRIRGEAHGRNDVRGVGSELRAGECDAFGRAARRGGDFQMLAIRWKRQEGRGFLFGIERTGDETSAPTAEQIEDKFRTGPLDDVNGLWIVNRAFAFTE